MPDLVARNTDGSIEIVAAATYLDQLIAILRTYPLQTEAPVTVASPTPSSEGGPGCHEPAIILSESFVADSP